MKRRTIIFVFLAVIVISAVGSAQTAEANHVWWTSRQRATRNSAAVEIGNEAHIIIQNYAAYTLPEMGAYDVAFETNLPYAPKIDKTGATVPKAFGGQADIVVWYDMGVRNLCEVYEIKSMNSRATKTTLAQAQLLAYIKGINDDPEMPCRGTRGMVWIPAIYPNWFTIPDEYSLGWGAKGVELRVTSTCVGNPAECGIIWYQFRWKRDKDKQLAASSGERSRNVGQFIVSTINERRERIKTKWDAQQLVASLQAMVDKYEVDPDADDDAWQQLIDIRRPDGTIDPWVTNAGVMDAIDEIMTTLRRVPYIVIPVPASGSGYSDCPFTSPNARDQLCA